MGHGTVKLGEVLKDVFRCSMPVVIGAGISVDEPYAGADPPRKLRLDTTHEPGAVEPRREIRAGPTREIEAMEPPREVRTTDPPREVGTTDPPREVGATDPP